MTTVTLRWSDPEEARDFLILQGELHRDGYLFDADTERLKEVVGASEVVAGEQDGTP